MKNILLSLSILLFITIKGCSQYSDTNNINWIDHIENDLIPFWITADAKGVPLGNFPTFRCNNGKIQDCPELNIESIPEWLRIQSDSLQRDYVRMKSRQIFLYSVAYHLTGKEDYLENAKNGVDYILSHVDYKNFKIHSFWQDRKKLPTPQQVTSQDLAYSLCGLTFFYYITRDKKLLDIITHTKNEIFNNYLLHSNTIEKDTLFAWVKEDFETDKTTNKELVANLDQVNAYLLLIAPLVNDSLADRYKSDLLMLSKIMNNNFYNAESNVYWGKLHDKKYGLEYHTDFGHTIKTFWMEYLIGKMVNDSTLILFAKNNALKLLKEAYIKETGSWGSCYSDGGPGKKINCNKSWWIYAELDQMTATLSMADKSLYNTYLNSTYEYWMDHFVDRKDCEVWHELNCDGNPNLSIPKIHIWKNGYHSFEHALVAYITTSSINNKEVTLYWALNNGINIEKEYINPYYFKGEIKNIESTDFNRKKLGCYSRFEVHFTDIR